MNGKTLLELFYLSNCIHFCPHQRWSISGLPVGYPAG